MIRISVSNKHGSSQFEHDGGPLVFGREARGDPGRRVIEDDYVSKDQLRIEELPGSRVRLDNLSSKVFVRCSDGTAIAPRTTRELALPAHITVGMTAIHLVSETADSVDSGSLRTIARPSAPTGLTIDAAPNRLGETPGTDQLVLWFETLIAVQRAAACSGEFYREIAQAVVQLIGLDSGLFLRRAGDGWRVVAGYAAGGRAPSGFSLTVLDRVRAERRTFYQVNESSDAVQSLAGVTTVVAAPVFDEDGTAVIGAVYGSKAAYENLAVSAIQPLHAQLVQVLAAAATAGIARMGSEAEAARRHVQFEQFFSRELAAELDRDPDLLSGRDREVTVLVSDVRGFSRISERVGPRETCSLMNDVLERLTVRIQDEGGVVVDYVGDGIVAMWNAPLEQPDHAARACRAALAMLGEIPGLNARWAGRIGVPIALGIGINTGQALVGNIGSPQRLKYGPLGHTVNLASRVEGATKQLGVPVLITAETHSRILESFATRRLCHAQVVGIDAPVDLHELLGEPTAHDRQAGHVAYENALALFERGQLSEAWSALIPLLQITRDDPDKPALALAARVIEGLRSPRSGIDPLIVFDSK
ncbi:MAG: adenylate/guanylate cyclase domain-containing protein [Isosphaeraceae bacterium]|nr:adenylate/guanylate cyclase domain-containing protein [Isosphaeraceae bacterium]